MEELANIALRAARRAGPSAGLQGRYKTASNNSSCG